MMGRLVMAEEVRAARQQALTHVLLAFVGGAFAGWCWTDPWGVLGFLPGLRGIVTFLAAAACLYELVVGAQYYQKASHLADVPAGASPGPGVEGPWPCRRCGRPRIPGEADCGICGEPARA
jgi:hypothetical protein